MTSLIVFFRSGSDVSIHAKNLFPGSFSLGFIEGQTPTVHREASFIILDNQQNLSPFAIQSCKKLMKHTFVSENISAVGPVPYREHTQHTEVCRQ